LYAGLATRQAVEQFLRELQGTGKTNTILLSGSCLAAAQEVPLEVQQAVIRALLAVPNSAADEVLSILDALDARIVTREAITAVHTLSTLHAIEYLTDKTDPSVAAALEAASCKVMIGDADNTTHGLATIASLIHMPTQEALQGIQRLDERARGMGHEDLAEYIGKAIEKQVDEVVQGVPGGRSVGVGWGKGRIADEGLMEVIQEIFLGLIVVPRAMREKHRGKPMATWGYLVTRVVETIEIRRGYIRRVAAGRSPKPKGHAETRVGLASHMQRFSEIAWAEQQRKCKSATEEIRQLVALQRGF
jgi:hypothetical protein